MKLNSIAFTLAAAASIVAASPSPHRHHHHAEKRAPDTKVITVERYEIAGQPATLQEVCDGLKSGKLATSNGATLPQCLELYGTSDNSSTENKQEQPPVNSSPGPKKESPSVIPIHIAPDTGNKQGPTPIGSSTNNEKYSPPVASFTQTNPLPSSPPVSSGSNAGQGLDRDFPDGEIDCSEFPSDYGPIAIDWMGIGGWSGIQYVTVDGDSVTHIDTAIPGGKNCAGNAMCSYACPEGYQKSQWPSTQGSAGESVGGLSCNSNGKLALTNPDLSKKLCIKGTGATKVQNNLQTNVAICRTDYPGTENEVVPLNTQPGSLHELTCPDSKSYFHHEGALTTAQYYVNRKGVSMESACIWGKDGTSQGNWAPTVIGVGRDGSGRTWLSITTTTQNRPTSYQPLDYTLTLKGDGLSGKCRVQNGKYCSGDDYGSCNSSGCTVELISGTATYEMSE